MASNSSSVWDSGSTQTSAVTPSPGQGTPPAMRAPSARTAPRARPVTVLLTTTTEEGSCRSPTTAEGATAQQAPARGHPAWQGWTLLLRPRPLQLCWELHSSHRSTQLLGGARSRAGSELHTGRLGWNRVPRSSGAGASIHPSRCPSRYEGAHSGLSWRWLGLASDGPFKTA